MRHALDDKKREKVQLLSSIRFPILFTCLLWVVKIIETLAETDFTYLGLYPLDLHGARGILFSPLIHGSWEHLINNSIAVFSLTWALFYFYRSIALKVFFLIYFIHGFWLWFMGRYAFHIGASGIIYGLGAFLFVSGIIRKNTHLLAISLLVAFLYGSMVWGIFPLQENVSWEAHLSGMVAGLVLAYYYKNYGPPPNIGRWKNEGTEEDFEEIEDDDNTAGDGAYWNSPDLKDKEKN
jgi:membrane associated rhomboid family serine protease